MCVCARNVASISYGVRKKGSYRVSALLIALVDVVSCNLGFASDVCVLVVVVGVDVVAEVGKVGLGELVVVSLGGAVGVVLWGGRVWCGVWKQVGSS